MLSHPTVGIETPLSLIQAFNFASFTYTITCAWVSAMPKSKKPPESSTDQFFYSSSASSLPITKHQIISPPSFRPTSPSQRKNESNETDLPLPLNPQIDPPPLRRSSSRTLPPLLFLPFSLLGPSPLPLPLLLIRTPTVVKLANVTAIEQLLLQTLIDFIMDMARPRRGGGAGGYLGRELGEDGAEVGCAFAAAGWRKS